MSDTLLRQGSVHHSADEVSKRPVVAVTVVSSNQDLLVPFLDSLLKYSCDDCETKIHVVWNAPSRGGPPLPQELVKRYHTVVMTESFTSGFAPNQNLLLTQVAADYYLIVNDDIIFLPGSIDKPLKYLERCENSGVGMLAIRLLNADGTLQPSTYSFPGILRVVLGLSGLRSLIPLSPKFFRLASFLRLGSGKSRYWPHRETVEVETFRGSYMFVRGTALNEVGLMDLRGGEETEWHARFHRHGWKIVFYSEAEVIHLGSMTVSKDPERDLIALRVALNLYHKHMPRWRYALVRFCCFLIYVEKYAVAKFRSASRARDVARKGLRLIIGWPPEMN